MTQAEWPPGKPERFSRVRRLSLGDTSDSGDATTELLFRPHHVELPNCRIGLWTEVARYVAMFSRRPAVAVVLGAVAFVMAVGAGSSAIVLLMPPAEMAPPPKDAFLADLPSSSATLPMAATVPRTEPSREQEVPFTGEASSETPLHLPKPGRPAPPPPVARPDRPPPRNLAALPTQEIPAVAPKPVVRPPQPAADPRYRNVLTPAEIRRLKLSLRLTAEQEPHWPPVEAVLTEIGAQQMALARAGQDTAAAFSGTTFRIYSAARPLLGLLREDQKAQIRNRARAMGLESVASYL